VPARRILVVDDNRDLAENIAELFSGQAGECRVAHSAAAGRALAEAADFDLAIVDIRLPDRSGVELTRELKDLRPDCEVILMTANASLDSAVAAVRQGTYAYLEKPFDVADLLRLGGRALEQVRLRRERARLQEELSHSEALYRGVVDSADSYIVGLDRQGTVRMWNRYAAAATGRQASEVVGWTLGSLLAGTRAAGQLAAALEHVWASGSARELELGVIGRDGKQRVVRWSLSRGQERDGQLFALCVGRDVTDRLELEARAAEAEAMASLGTLTAGLAHEIRNPLNAATLQLELLARSGKRLPEPDRERFDARIGIVKQELLRLTNLLNDFLNLARPRALQVEDVDLKALVQEVTVLHEAAAQQRGVQVQRDCDADPVIARGEGALLKQVLINLLVNALEALANSGAGSTIRVGCHNLGDNRVELFVRDDGPGIAPELSETLFAPFVTSKEAGTGLGLTIVKRIVDRHGGTVQLDPVPGGGTVASVTLTRGG
jgi:PAS domain S-box-containing protein